MEQNKKKSGTSIGGLVFVGCMFMGWGIGKLYGTAQTGETIGMAVGFFAMAGIWAYYRNK